MTTPLPRLVVAAPASGAGKTTVATGLMAALAERGLVVSPHKVGPDYIDPGYHAVAAGRPGRNLDPHLQGEHRAVPLMLHGAGASGGRRPADVAVVEGVLGLFDGALGRDGFASTAHVAALTGSPVLLVVDAASASRSVAALVHGFATFDPAVRIGGVVLNRVGSDRHEAEIRAALARTGVPVLGVLRRDAGLAVPSRHLGLVPAAEHVSDARTAVEAMGAAVAAGVDLEAVVALARSAPPLAGSPWDAGEEVRASATTACGATSSGAPAACEDARRRPVVAVASGPAFTFGYAENLELLRAAGADVVAVDPLAHEALPADVAGLVVGGGFPEVHAARLSENEGLRAAVATLAARGAPVVGECAGLLYLARSLDGAAMCGVLPVDAAMGPRLVLGYRSAVAVTDSVLARAGTTVTGHEFHRTALVTPTRTRAPARPAWRLLGGPAPEALEGVVAGPAGTVHASYLHVHWAGHPAMARRLVDAARAALAGSLVPERA